ncbi:restriction endonuclease [Paenibacillus sp. FSL E2-0190]|uniref:restriction endonuclease n=1 Tax=Paenibacillus sp. FSL E2-0190 TaxID=2954504 RepID=UPI0030ECC983
MGVVIGRGIKLLLIELGVIFPEPIINFVLLPLAILFIGLLLIGWIKFFIDRQVLKKCKHGVRYGVVEGICVDCFQKSENNKNTKPLVEDETIVKVKGTLKTIPGKCRCCSSTVKIRYQHQTIPEGTELKYDVEEIKGWKEEYKKVCHLSSYPPQKYYLDLCDDCYKEMAIGFVKEVEYGSWLGSLGKSIIIFFWIVLIILILDLVQLTPDTISWIVVSYFGATLYIRYVFDRKTTTASTKAAKAMDEFNRESDDITRTLALINRMDKEAEEARERIRVRNASGINEIDKMSGIEFEQRLAAYFIHKGFMVKTTATSGDHGADLIIEIGNRRIAIQAKRYGKQSVGNKAIQEAISGRIMYDCNEAWVITTSTFTKSAYELADKADVKLIDRSELIKMLGDSLSAAATS